MCCRRREFAASARTRPRGARPGTGFPSRCGSRAKGVFRCRSWDYRSAHCPGGLTAAPGLASRRQFLLRISDHPLMGIDLLLSTIAIRKEWEPDWLAAARAIAAIDFRSRRIQDGRAQPRQTHRPGRVASQGCAPRLLDEPAQRELKTRQTCLERCPGGSAVWPGPAAEEFTTSSEDDLSHASPRRAGRISTGSRRVGPVASPDAAVDRRLGTA